MKKSIKKRYISAIENMADAKYEGDMSTFYFYSGVVSGIRTSVFLSSDMSLDDYHDLVKMEEEYAEKRRRVLE